MTTTGAVPSLLLALTMVSIGATAFAAPLNTNPSPPSATAKPAAKTAAQPKNTNPADPFEETATPAKAAAIPTAPPPPPLPSKELEAFMKGFEGRWKCDTQFATGTLRPGSQPLSAKTEVTIRKEFDGFSWHGEFKLAKTAATPAASGVFQIGYAAASKQATFLSYDSVGSSMMGAGAISGDSVTFAEEGYMKGTKVKVRETMAKKGPRKLHHKVEIDQGKGYQPMAEDTCTK